MFARGAFPLCLLLLAWTFPTLISCQKVDVTVVSTQYVEVTWTRTMLWVGVNEFDINISSEGSSACIMTGQCTSITCSFDSRECGLFLPCSPTNITISGGSYTAPTVSLVTGPERVSAIKTSLNRGVEYISWTNPSADSSPCYEDTSVWVTYNDKISFSSYGREEESINMSLCVMGSGEVEAWAEGGNGSSLSSSATFTYSGSDVIDLVEFEGCEAVNCTGLEIQWSYCPVCPYVDHFDVFLDMSFYRVPINTTTLTLMDLGLNHLYDTYVVAMSKYEMVLGSTSTHNCGTSFEVPRNLAVETLNSSSLRVTWDPPLCSAEPLVPYRLTIDGGDEYITNATTYDVGSLKPFTLYHVELQVHRNQYSYDDNVVSTYGRTSAPTPSLHIDSVESDSIEVSWDSNYNGFYEANYNVTWGKHLQFEEETTEESFAIMDFNSTDEVYKVCVATILDDRENLVSQTDCKFIDDFHNGLSGGAIAGIVIGSVLLIALLVGLFVACNKKKNSETGSRQTQNPHHKMQERLRNNPAASQ